MPTVDQTIRALARRYAAIPYWVLEKDYALSYLLSGIARTDEFREGLVLKGGVALRKFYFPDYRFSEDLDCSVRPGASLFHVDAAMSHAVHETERILQELGPFQVLVERLTLREPHPGGQDAFVVRVRFPAHREPLCRLKVEITRDEVVLLPPQHRQLLHGFPEELSAALWCYPLEEIVAEKLRALLQSRARLRDRGWGASRVCRDYYDLWYILRRAALRKDLLPDLVSQKCVHRGATFDSPEDFFTPDLLEVTRVEWERQLSPFVPNSPDRERILTELRPLVVNLF